MFPPSPCRYVGTIHVRVVHLVIWVDGFRTTADVIVGLDPREQGWIWSRILWVFKSRGCLPCPFRWPLHYTVMLVFWRTLNYCSNNWPLGMPGKARASFLLQIVHAHPNIHCLILSTITSNASNFITSNPPWVSYQPNLPPTWSMPSWLKWSTHSITVRYHCPF